MSVWVKPRGRRGDRGRWEARPRVWEPPGPAGVASGPRPAWQPGLCCLRGFRSVTRSLPQRGRKLGRGTKTPFTVSFQFAGGKARVPCEAEPAQRETAREPRLAATLATRVTSGRSPRKTSVGFLPPSAGAFNKTRSREREPFQAGFRPRRRCCNMSQQNRAAEAAVPASPMSLRSPAS